MLGEGRHCVLIWKQKHVFEYVSAGGIWVCLVEPDL